jgi:hypothetical protein
MKKILSVLMILSILASLPISAGAADIPADKCYPGTSVPMLDNVLFINYVSTETKFEASETISYYYYDITYPYEEKMATYKGYLLYNGFSETAEGLAKGRFTVE